MLSKLDPIKIIDAYKDIPSGYGLMTGLLGIIQGIRYLKNENKKINSFELGLKK